MVLEVDCCGVTNEEETGGVETQCAEDVCQVIHIIVIVPGVHDHLCVRLSVNLLLS